MHWQILLPPRYGHCRGGGGPGPRPEHALRSGRFHHRFLFLRRVRGGGLWGVRWARGKNHTASEPRAHKKVFVTYDQGTQEGVNRVSVAPSSSV